MNRKLQFELTWHFILNGILCWHELGCYEDACLNMWNNTELMLFKNDPKMQDDKIILIWHQMQHVHHLLNVVKNHNKHDNNVVPFNPSKQCLSVLSKIVYATWKEKKMSKINRNIWCWFDFFYNLVFLQRGRNVIGFWNTCSSNEVRNNIFFFKMK